MPEPEVVTADDLNRLNASELRKPAVRERLLAEETVAKLLGLIEFDDDVLGVAQESGDLAAAAYDPRTDELYVVQDAVGVSPALTEFVLAHELNHALEDQQYDLSDRLGTGDRDLALTALVEGTATVAMIRYARRFQNVLALSLAAGRDRLRHRGRPAVHPRPAPVRLHLGRQVRPCALRRNGTVAAIAEAAALGESRQAHGLGVETGLVVITSVLGFS